MIRGQSKWCDFCWKHTGVRAPAVNTWEVFLAKGVVRRPKFRQVDVCQIHDRYMTVVIVGMYERGKPLPPAKPRRRSQSKSPNREEQTCAR